MTGLQLFQCYLVVFQAGAIFFLRRILPGLWNLTCVCLVLSGTLRGDVFERSTRTFCTRVVHAHPEAWPSGVFFFFEADNVWSKVVQ